MEQSYKEKYEQALEKIKNLIDKDHNDINVDDILNVFPELVKSEEEKIKKRITLCLEECVHSDVIRDYEKDECIAWLENIPVIIDHEKREGFHFGYKACLERQGKQKPEENKGDIGGISPNWSEEEEAVLDALIRRLKGEDIHVSPHLAVECLESLKGRVQPKQEWSEEDKYMYDILCGTIENTDINENTKYKLISWLKSLKDRVGCEANCTTTKEWSDDDKRKIDRIYSILRQAAGTHAFSTSCRLIGDKECMELQDWLKSLRPQSQWKPSSEQIGLLQAIINEPKNAASESCQIVLREVLEQLKKLKEE